MVLVNTDYISGKNLEMLGLVKGSTIQSKDMVRDFSQALKTMVGGAWRGRHRQYQIFFFCSHAGRRRGHSLWHSGEICIV